MPEMKDWVRRILQDGWPTARQNMQQDHDIIEQLQPFERVERYYWWQQPGITYSYKQTCPDNMAQLDHSVRSTGGGIVCHSPGDLVFSMAYWLTDPSYQGTLTQVLQRVSHRMQTALSAGGAVLDATPTSGPVDRDWCAHYPTPFEFSINHQKICGLTIRRYRKKALVQGVLHMAHSDPVFLPYHPPRHAVPDVKPQAVMDYLCGQPT